MEKIDIKNEELKQQPIERAETIPSSWYHSQEVFEFEQEFLFASFWQYACHENELPNTGDRHTLEVAGNPLLLVRDQEEFINHFQSLIKRPIKMLWKSYKTRCKAYMFINS